MYESQRSGWEGSDLIAIGGDGSYDPLDEHGRWPAKSFGASSAGVSAKRRPPIVCFLLSLLLHLSVFPMLDDSDSHGEQSAVGPASLLPPIPQSLPLPVVPVVHEPPEPGPSKFNQESTTADVNSLHISPPPFSPTSSGNVSPTTPRSLERDQKPAKRPNPLIDLIDTEKTYVDLLSGIIRVTVSLPSSSRFPLHTEL